MRDSAGVSILRRDYKHECQSDRDSIKDDLDTD